MCRVHVQYCPSCRLYSPVLILQPSECRPKYYLVHDTICRNFLCLKAKMVNTCWCPDNSHQLDDFKACPSCPLNECCVITIYRDCQSSTYAHQWLPRKIVTEPWTPYYKLLDLC